MKIAMTTLSSKILSQDKEYFAKLAVDAVMRLKVKWFMLYLTSDFFLIDLLLLLLIFFGWGRGLCILSCHGFEPILRKQSFNWRYRMTCFCLSVYEIKFLFFFPAVTSVPGVVFSCSSVIMHCVPVCCLYFTPV